MATLKSMKLKKCSIDSISLCELTKDDVNPNWGKEFMNLSDNEKEQYAKVMSTTSCFLLESTLRLYDKLISKLLEANDLEDEDVEIEPVCDINKYGFEITIKVNSSGKSRWWLNTKFNWMWNTEYLTEHLLKPDTICSFIRNNKLTYQLPTAFVHSNGDFSYGNNPTKISLYDWVLEQSKAAANNKSIYRQTKY